MVTEIQLEEGVRRAYSARAYSAAALAPADNHPFPVGRQFALEVGYPAELLDTLPTDSVDTFAGVSNVAIYAELEAGAHVIDLGCGAGLDSLVAAGRVGSQGVVNGVDFSEDMIARAQRAAEEHGASNVELHAAQAQELPLASGSIDVALVNGIFNLNPDRQGVFRELFRVLRPGGAVYASELVLLTNKACTASPSLDSWFS